ncbi:MAG: hypothetical protein L3J70_11585 [Gammaproteobacteria bacterium]|nr:hypothetical protein [Gammaproteobacteria bacterium]
MSQLLVRNLDEETVKNLKRRAIANHRSLQAEVALILENAAKIQSSSFWKGAQTIREQLVQSNKTFSDSSLLVREERDR